MKITEPTAPREGVAPITRGRTVKFTPLLAAPDTVTTTLPVVAASGTLTDMLVSLQELTIAVAPLKVTVLPPCVVPKFAPEMVASVPLKPLLGLSEVIVWHALWLKPNNSIDTMLETDTRRKRMR